MKKLLLVAPALALVLVAGCDLFGAGEDYFPMSVGSVWNYSAVTTMETTLAASLDTVSTMTQRNEATRKTKLTDETEVTEFIYSATVTTRLPAESTYTMVDTFYIREGENCLLGYGDLGDTTPETLAIYPFVVDKTWRQGNGTARVIGQEDVTVTAGTYKNAWKVELTPDGQPDFHIYYWYGNKVGQVRSYYSSTVQSYTYKYDFQLVNANIR
jgi:hypothetical protein